jgi:glucokinase
VIGEVANLPSGERGANLLVLSFGTGIGGGFVVNGSHCVPTPTEPRTIGHVRGLSNAARCSCGSRGCLQTALRTMPDEQSLERDPSGWPEGQEMVAVCADMCRMLGVENVVLTGGLLNRSLLKRMLEALFRDEALKVRTALNPDLSAALGALLL